MKKIVTVVLAVFTSFSMFVPVFAASPVYTPAATAKAQQVVSTIILPGMTDTQKVQACNDYLVNTVTYDYTFTNYTADSALLYGTSVCEGYAEAFKLLMDTCGIPCDILIDDVMDHAWNRVYINGVPYEIDVTWNDTDRNGYYTLLTSQQMLSRHLEDGPALSTPSLYGEDDWGEGYEDDTEYDNSAVLNVHTIDDLKKLNPDMVIIPKPNM